MMNPDLSLNPFGRLVLVTPDGVSHEGVTPVRAFPVAAPEEGIAAGTRWEDVPADWLCPECQMGKHEFEMMEI